MPDNTNEDAPVVRVVSQSTEVAAPHQIAVPDLPEPTFDEQPEWLGSDVNEEAREQARLVMEQRMGLASDGGLTDPDTALPWSPEEIKAGEAQRFADEQRERADAFGDALVSMSGSLAMMAQTMRTLGDLAAAAAEASSFAFEMIRTTLETLDLNPDQIEGLAAFGVEVAEDGTIEFTTEVGDSDGDTSDEPIRYALAHGDTATGWTSRAGNATFDAVDQDEEDAR